jgi:AcrR family transcriptional regulator
MRVVDPGQTVQQLRDQRRASRRAQNRADILEAAELVFAQDGIRDGSIRRIAEESGFSAAAIYLFFENKDDLAAHVLTTRGEELIAVIRTVTERGADPLTTLHQIVDETIRFFGDRPNFRFLLHHIRGGPAITGPVLPEAADRGSDRFRSVMDLLAAVVRAGQAQGQIREGEPAVLAHFYSVLINEFVLLDANAPTDGPGASGDGFSVEQFHDLVDDALRSRSR